MSRKDEEFYKKIKDDAELEFCLRVMRHGWSRNAAYNCWLTHVRR